MILLLISFIFMLLIGVPVAFSLGWAAIVFAFVQGGTTIMALPFRMFTGVNNFVFLAIPLFCFAGELMVCTGILARLIKFATLLLGRLRGGLAHISIVASMIFAGISGSAIADAAAIGSVLIPAMSKEYNPRFGAGLVAAASTIGPIIPPSVPMIIYSMATGGVSIAGLFLAGVIPGFMIGVGMMIIVYYQAVKYDFPVEKSVVSWKELLSSFIDVLPAFFMPVIILGGILGGIFTATESAAVAVLYALLVGFFVTRSLVLKDVWVALINSAKISSMVFLVIATAFVLAWMLIEAKLPEMATEQLQNFSSSPLVFLLLLNVFLLMVGCVIECSSAMVMLMPIISPIAISFGIHPLHLGIVVVLNLVIGLITPPVGTCLFVACGIAKLPIQIVVKSMWPYLVWQIVVLIIVTYFPSISLIVPNLFGF